MTNETRRRKMREALMAKARQLQEADRQRRLETIGQICEARRNLKKPYSPEVGMALFRDLFGNERHTATIGNE